jgi:hypothetical protein
MKCLLIRRSKKEQEAERNTCQLKPEEVIFSLFILETFPDFFDSITLKWKHYWQKNNNNKAN